MQGTEEMAVSSRAEPAVSGVAKMLSNPDRLLGSEAAEIESL